MVALHVYVVLINKPLALHATPRHLVPGHSKVEDDIIGPSLQKHESKGFSFVPLSPQRALKPKSGNPKP